MKCFRCGAENLEKSRFCCMCGVKLEEDGDKDTVPLEKIADAGDANAQCELGAVYFRGEVFLRITKKLRNGFSSQQRMEMLLLNGTFLCCMKKASV